MFLSNYCGNSRWERICFQECGIMALPVVELVGWFLLTFLSRVRVFYVDSF
uniref:Uncharacterized protein n=1 Tax=Rhizophora mucronata TaxID=61149 RepID=A0A2P2PAP7_RHIMU